MIARGARRGWGAKVDRRAKRKVYEIKKHPAVKVMVTRTARSLIGHSIGGKLVIAEPPRRPKLP
jgi:hypothetical protein